jgi:hypothetical protein
MRDAVGVVFLVEGDGLLGPSEPRQSSEVWIAFVGIY